MNTTKRERVSRDEPETFTRLPEELILEILTWAPGRELGRSKCVCKLWKTLIGSPPFLILYRRRNPCLMLHRSDGSRLHFQYSPLRRHRTDADEDFRQLGSFPVGQPVTTQLVNGVICTGNVVGDKILGRERELQLNVISVCTGQALPIPRPLPEECLSYSTYHLGYDPRSRRYKLLRLKLLQPPHGMRADIVTLGPTGTVWEWRKLDNDAAGIHRLPLRVVTLHTTVSTGGVLMFPGDGVLCWKCGAEGIILFDMNKEVFRWVKLPPACIDIGWSSIVPRVVLDGDRSVIYMWSFPKLASRRDLCSGDYEYKLEFECFVLEDDEGKVWRKNSFEFHSGLQMRPSCLEAANGSSISFSESSIMLINSDAWLDGRRRRREVYCCTIGEEMRRYWVGFALTTQSFCTSQLRVRNAARGFDTRLSCLLESNVLYLSLKDVLDGNG